MEARALAVILAAGEGKRMKSILPKVLHRLGGQPLIEHVVQSCLRAGMDRTLIVVGHRRDMVIETLQSYPIEFVLQEPQLGTGHAMQQVVRQVGSLHGTCAVFLGDAPFISPETMARMVEVHRQEGNAVTVLTAELDDPEGYGRIVRSSDGQVERIVEHGDATEAELEIREINSGMYCFDYNSLVEALNALDDQNHQGEFYLTDTIGILRQNGAKVGVLKASDPIETWGINDFRQLGLAERIFKEREALTKMAPTSGAPAASPAAGETYSAGGDEDEEDEDELDAGMARVYHATPDDAPVEPSGASDWSDRSDGSSGGSSTPAPSEV